MGMHWWVDLATDGFGGLVAALLILGAAAVVVLAVLTGVLHGIAGTRDHFRRGFRRGWDRDAGDLPRT